MIAQNPEFYIGSRKVGIDSPPLVIPEIGINHGGSLEIAMNMVKEIAYSGAECVKHQTHFVEDEMTEEAKNIYPPNADMSIWEVMKNCSLSEDDEKRLKEYAESLGLIYISTPFSRKAADFLNDINVPAFKIGSGEADNLPLIRHISSFGKPVIMSTGMQSIRSLTRSVQILRDSGVPFALLECTNLYPSPPEIVSLSGVTELKKAFSDAVIGFSDHSIGPSIALASVALGSSIVERHFTDTRYRKGPDISCSMDMSELRFLVDTSREVYIATRNPKGRTAPEESVYKFARGSIVADCDLNAGDIIQDSSIWARRPGTGEIAADEFDALLGRKVRCNIKRNTQLSWSDFY